MLETVLSFMVMVVMEGMCVHAIRTTISNLKAASMLETVLYSLRQ